MEASKRADIVRKIHVKIKETIEKKCKYTAVCRSCKQEAKGGIVSAR
jgi:hypothetical protein